MRIGKLEISTQRAQYEITTVRARLNITTHRPQMAVKSSPATMQVRRKMPTFRVNWARVRAESGLKNPEYMRQYQVQEGRAYHLETLGMLAREGDQKAAIHTGANAVADIAVQRRESRNRVDLNSGPMPQSLPEIEWDFSPTEIDWQPGSLNVDWVVSPPTIEVEPYHVEIKIKNYPSVKINYIPPENAVRVGKKVDRYI